MNDDSRLRRSPYRLTDGPMLPAPRDPRRARLVGLLGCLTIAALLFATHPHWLRGYALLFRVNDPAPSDALMILLGGPSHRPARALELYRAGVAPRILLGEGVGTVDGVRSEAAITRSFLVANGVPESAIEILPGTVFNTRDEAIRLRDHASVRGLRRVTIVTTAFHTSRALWIFQKLCAGLPLELRAAAAEEPHFSETDWFRSGPGLSMYAVETVKQVFYRCAY